MQKLRACGIFISTLLVCFCGSAMAAEDEPVGLERIVVSKPKACLAGIYSRYYGSLEDLPASFSAIESLNFLPVDLQSRTPGTGTFTDFSMRGSNFQGVLMLVNGQRINDPQTGHFNSELPLTKEDIEKIEVMPGASSSLFGPDAIGGALNFRVKKPKENRLAMELSGGSFNSADGLFSVSRRLTDDLGCRLSVQRGESSGFRYDTGFKDFISSLTASLDIPDGQLNTVFGYQDKSFGAFDFYTPGLGYPSKEWTKTCLLDTGLTINKSGFIVKPDFIWRRHYDKFALDKTGIKSSYLNRSRNDIFTPNIYFQKDTGLLGRVGAGLEYGQERISSANLGKHVRQHKSIFADGSKDLTPKASLGVSLRADDFAGFDGTYTGSLNLKYRLSASGALNFGAAQNIRVPSFTELYYSDPTTAGDPALSREKAINYQFGYEHNGPGISSGATLFLRDEKDMVDWVKTSADQARFRADNITEDKIYGVEAYSNLKLKEWCSLDINYAYANRDAKKMGYIYKYGQNYTRHLANALCAFRLPFGTQSIGWTYKKKPGRSGWLIMDARFSCNLSLCSRIFVNLGNLLNTKYEEIVGVPQPGRYVEGGIRFDW